MTTNWIEEQFNKIYPYGIVRKYKKLGYVDLSDDIKTFITTLLEKQREEYVENIKGLQYEHANVARHGNTPDDAYDRVLNYLEYELKSNDKTS